MIGKISYFHAHAIAASSTWALFPVVFDGNPYRCCRFRPYPGRFLLFRLRIVLNARKIFYFWLVHCQLFASKASHNKANMHEEAESELGQSTIHQRTLLMTSGHKREAIGNCIREDRAATISPGFGSGR
jgi:hypothetical protein